MTIHVADPPVCWRRVRFRPNARRQLRGAERGLNIPAKRQAAGRPYRFDVADLRQLAYRLGRERASLLLAASSLFSIFPNPWGRDLRLRVGAEVSRAPKNIIELRMWHSFVFVPRPTIRSSSLLTNFFGAFATVR